jgi:hypothetical protein
MTTRSAAASSAGASPPAIAITTLRSNASSTAETAAAKEDLKKRHLHEEEEEDQDEQDEHTEDEDVVLDEVDDPEDNENTQSSSLGVHDDDSNENGLLLTGGSSSTSLVPGTVTPGTIMPTSGKQVQLYDSKRMTRVSFNSWFEFDQYFETYMQETFQPFRMRSSCSVEAYRRNQQKVMNNNKNSRGRRIEFPDSAVHHHRIYMCTHAMKARCRGATTRPGQKYRGIGCIAKINVKISPSDNQSKYMVIVTDQVSL